MSEALSEEDLIEYKVGTAAYPFLEWAHEGLFGVYDWGLPSSNEEDMYRVGILTTLLGFLNGKVIGKLWLRHSFPGSLKEVFFGRI